MADRIEGTAKNRPRHFRYRPVAARATDLPPPRHLPAASVLSFIVPAHEESASIAAAVQAIRTAAGGRAHEIVVVDDASCDDTGARAAAAGAQVLRVAHRQIAATRNAGARAARGEVLVFVDADTFIAEDVVAGLERAIAGGAVGGGAGVRFDEPVPRWAKVLLPPALAIFRWLNLAGGCFVFARRADFEALGGFDEALYAAEELALCRALARRGRFVVLRETVLTSGRKLRTHSGGEIAKAALRVAVAGRAGVRDRSRLDLWYAPRREDPAARR
jgi:glycosyltransferase involved in cell wall biosynthesis